MGVTPFGTPVFKAFTVSQTPCTSDLNSLATSSSDRVVILGDIAAETIPVSPAASYFTNSEPVLCRISYTVTSDDGEE